MSNVTRPLPADANPIGDESALIHLEGLSPEQQQQVRALVAHIDVDNTPSIIAFGAEAQNELTGAADQMLERARNKDVGPVGAVLGDLMLKVRGLGIDDLQPGEKPNWFQRHVLPRLQPLARFIERYETVQSQIEDTVTVLEGHKLRLVRDVTLLDRLFQGTLAFLQHLELYIAAAQLKLRELDEHTLPTLQAKAAETGDLLDAQLLHDRTARRDDLERRLHDLRLTRQVTLQSLPQIRLIQDVDQALVTRIQSSVLTTIPVWKQQIAQAITLWNQQRALETLQDVDETTRQMMEENARRLRVGSAEARRQVERGVFDIETIKKVNAELIATIEESIQIAEEGRRKRIEGAAEMQRLESDLRQALMRTQANRPGEQEQPT